MCGITGILDYSVGHNHNEQIVNMTNALSHRGPDSDGFFTDQFINLGHRRLSVLDLSEQASQPMTSYNQRFVIVYNGELYNYKEIKKELKLKGCVFRGNSDTEVVLEAFVLWGPSCLKKFNGMFVFAIWDRDEQELTLARDRFGIKPCYYRQSGNGLMFSSEIKSLLIDKKFNRSVNLTCLKQFLFFGYTHSPNTIFDGIHELEPGSQMVVSRSRSDQSKYWCINDIGLSGDDENTAVDKVKFLLNNAVKNQLVSDVPICILLSGGVDSSAIAAYASKHYRNRLSTFSVDFDFNPEGSEGKKAAKIAEIYDTDHTNFTIEGSHLENSLIKLVRYFDEPFGDPASLPLYLIGSMLKGKFKVVLQGDGGDEIFGGYKRHQIVNSSLLSRLVRLLPNSEVFSIVKNSRIQRLNRLVNILKQKDNALQFALFFSNETLNQDPLRFLNRKQIIGYQSSSPFDKYQLQLENIPNRNKLQDFLFVENSINLPDCYLKKVDRSTMANSLEVRVPFLDNELTNYVLSIPPRILMKGNCKKWLLKKVLKDSIPKSILYAPKHGFTVPVSDWLRGPLKNFMKQVLLDPSFLNWEFINSHAVHTEISNHLSGKYDRGTMLWKLINLSLWKQEKLN